MRRLFVITLASIAIMACLSGCAADRNPMIGTPGPSGVAGFWMGLWHGLICFFSFVISLFNKDVQIYEVHNNGAWYNFGFILGAGSSLGGAGRSSRPR